LDIAVTGGTGTLGGAAQAGPGGRLAPVRGPQVVRELAQAWAQPVPA
jgi:hypothetical protein